MDNQNEIHTTLDRKVYSGLYLKYRVMVTFLQDKKLTTRTILMEGKVVNDDAELRLFDLIDKGENFYREGSIPWKKKIDKSPDRHKAITDISFLEKQYLKFEKT